MQMACFEIDLANAVKPPELVKKVIYVWGLKEPRKGLIKENGGVTGSAVFLAEVWGGVKK